MKKDFDAAWRQAARGYRPGKDGKWRCVVFLSPLNWLYPDREFSEEDMRALEAKCLRHIGRKDDVMIVRTVRGNGDIPPFDPGFTEVCELALNREVDCVAVPDLRHFAGSSRLAYHWVRDIMAPARIRFLDASWRFDSLTCDVDAYIARVKGGNISKKNARHPSKHKKRKGGRKGGKKGE